MDKVREIESSFNHGISIAERKNILVTGVKKIESFDNEEFMMDTTLGFLSIKGSALEIIKLNNLLSTGSSKIGSFSSKPKCSAIKLFLNKVAKWAAL